MHQHAPAEFASTVYPAMLARTTGYVLASNAPRFQNNGDFSDGVSWRSGQNSHYWYGGIANSSFSFAFNLGDDDLSYRKANPARNSSLTYLYHKIVEYSHVPGVSVAVETGTNAMYGSNIPIAPQHMTFFVAARGFCDPVDYLLDHVSGQNPNTSVVHSTVNSDAPAGVGCSSHLGENWLHQMALDDVWVGYPIQDEWLARPAADSNSVPWTYFGTEHGVMMTLPGTRIERGYDPTRRGWYRKTKQDAQSSPHYSGGGAVLTAAYLDAFGSGMMATIASAIFQKTPSNTSVCAAGGRARVFI